MIFTAIAAAVLSMAPDAVKRFLSGSSDKGDDVLYLQEATRTILVFKISVNKLIETATTGLSVLTRREEKKTIKDFVRETACAFGKPEFVKKLDSVKNKDLVKMLKDLAEVEVNEKNARKICLWKQRLLAEPRLTYNTTDAVNKIVSDIGKKEPEGKVFKPSLPIWTAIPVPASMLPAGYGPGTNDASGFAHVTLEFDQDEGCESVLKPVEYALYGDVVEYTAETTGKKYWYQRVYVKDTDGKVCVRHISLTPLEKDEDSGLDFKLNARANTDDITEIPKDLVWKKSIAMPSTFFTDGCKVSFDFDGTLDLTTKGLDVGKLDIRGDLDTVGNLTLLGEHLQGICEDASLRERFCVNTARRCTPGLSDEISELFEGIKVFYEKNGNNVGDSVKQGIAKASRAVDFGASVHVDDNAETAEAVASKMPLSILVDSTGEKLERKFVEVSTSHKLVAISGLPGSGKSTLAQEVAKELRDQGLKVLVASPDQGFSTLGVKKVFLKGRGCRDFDWYSRAVSEFDIVIFESCGDNSKGGVRGDIPSHALSYHVDTGLIESLFGVFSRTGHSTIPNISTDEDFTNVINGNIEFDGEFNSASFVDLMNTYTEPFLKEWLGSNGHQITSMTVKDTYGTTYPAKMLSYYDGKQVFNTQWGLRESRGGIVYFKEGKWQWFKRGLDASKDNGGTEVYTGKDNLSWTTLNYLMSSPEGIDILRRCGVDFTVHSKIDGENINVLMEYVGGRWEVSNVYSNKFNGVQEDRLVSALGKPISEFKEEISKFFNTEAFQEKLSELGIKIETGSTVNIIFESVPDAKEFPLSVLAVQGKVPLVAFLGLKVDGNYVSSHHFDGIFSAKTWKLPLYWKVDWGEWTCFYEDAKQVQLFKKPVKDFLEKWTPGNKDIGSASPFSYELFVLTLGKPVNPMLWKIKGDNNGYYLYHKVSPSNFQTAFTVLSSIPPENRDAFMDTCLNLGSLAKSIWDTEGKTNEELFSLLFPGEFDQFVEGSFAQGKKSSFKTDSEKGPFAEVFQLLSAIPKTNKEGLEVKGQIASFFNGNPKKALKGVYTGSLGKDLSKLNRVFGAANSKNPTDEQVKDAEEAKGEVKAFFMDNARFFVLARDYMGDLAKRYAAVDTRPEAGSK